MKSTIREMDPVKILIVKLSSIGDVVHTLPALYSIKKGFEKKGVRAEIDWLVEEAASSLLTGNPLIDNVIVVKNRGWLKDTANNIKTAKAIFSRHYDIVLDFQGLLKSGLWVAVSRGKRRVGFSNAREMSHIFLNEKIAPYDPDRHAVERYLDLAKSIGGVLDKSATLNPGKASKESVLGKLDEKGLKRGAPFFVMISRARWATKLWNDDKFVTLAKKIAGISNITPVLAGGAADRAGIEAMRGRIGGRAISLAGEIDLKELAALLGLARFAVSVDSGPMHIAAAAGTRVIALFGPTAPWRTGPYGEGHVIIRKGLVCSPCFRKSCGDVRCMNEITVDEVLSAVSGLLDSAGPGTAAEKNQRKADG